MEEIINTQSATNSYTITPHPLSGTRQRARDLLWDIPEDLTESTVTVEAGDMKAFAQCFVDELCKQILTVRKAKQLRIATANETFRSRVEFSAGIRHFSERILFV